jgi:hypothetical protein
VPRSLKRKDPHLTPESSPRKATAAVKPSPSTAGSFSAETTGPARLKKTKIILHRSGLDYSGRPEQQILYLTCNHGHALLHRPPRQQLRPSNKDWPAPGGSW